MVELRLMVSARPPPEEELLPPPPPPPLLLLLLLLLWLLITELRRYGLRWTCFNILERVKR